METPGYSVAVHNALTSPILMGGVPRQLAILNGTFGAAVTFGLHSLYAIPVCIVVHVVSMIMAKKDPYFFQIGLRHLKQKSYYYV